MRQGVSPQRGNFSLSLGKRSLSRLDSLYSVGRKRQSLKHMAGRYKILDHLGAGGAGAVYKAYDTQLDRYVAIKRLLSKEEAERSDTATSTLRKEAASLATLQHPNIVSIYDLAGDDEGLFIVMELLEGEDVSVWLQRGTLELLDFKEFASQTLEGILSAHQVNILHRDLKPENIKIARLPGGRMQAKIVDFGLARMSYAARKQSEDQSGNVLGSIYYMAPEQFMRRPLDGRTDLYSLGCVLYQALAGRRPFEGATVRDVMEAHLHHTVQNLAEVCPKIPQPICDWVMWMINQDQAHRPANAQAALDHLRALANAGWFNVTPQASQEAAQTGEAQPSPPARRISSHVTAGSDLGRPARRTTSTQRPSAGAPRPPSGVVQQAVPAASAVMEPAVKKGISPWVFLAGAAVTAVVIWMFIPRNLTDGKLTTARPAGGGKNGKSTSLNGLPEQPKDLLTEGAILHYRAGLKMEPWLEGGQQKREIKPGDPITLWHDLEGRGGDASLVLFDRKKEFCPKYAFNKPSGFKDEAGMAQFEQKSGMFNMMDKSKNEAKEYPFGQNTKRKGVTVIMIVRPKMSDKEQRLFLLRNQDNNGSLSVQVFPNNEVKCIARAKGKDGKEVIKEGKSSGRNLKEFCMVTLTWDGTTNKIIMMVRNNDGNKSRTEFEAPKDCAVLNELSISSRQQNPSEKFIGDLMELVVWPFPMDVDMRTMQDQKIAEFYLERPGTRFN